VAGLGATTVRFDIPEYDALASTVSTSQFEARTVMDRYFAALGPGAPIKSFAELLAAKTSAVQKTLEAEFAVVDGMSSQAYKDRTLNRDKLQKTLEAKSASDLLVIAKELGVPFSKSKPSIKSLREAIFGKVRESLLLTRHHPRT
jgi:hypothetical protein